MRDNLLDPRELAIAALRGKGIPAQMHQGVPFINSEDIPTMEDKKAALDAIKALGYGADIFYEGVVIRPPR